MTVTHTKRKRALSFWSQIQAEEVVGVISTAFRCRRAGSKGNSGFFVTGFSGISCGGRRFARNRGRFEMES